MRVKRRKRTRTIVETYYEHQCPVCGTWYEPLRTDTYFCSTRCQQVAAYKRRKAARRKAK
jgi:predicted nucleic acid-binding Zn ribbon protein